MAGHRLKPGWKVWRFDQMAINVNDRIDNPSEADVEHYVGLEHLDPDSLRIRRWGVPTDVEATKLCFRKGDIIFGRRRVYQRKLAVAEFDGICSAHAMVLRPQKDVVLPEFLPFFMQSDLFMSRALEISVGSLSPTINWKTLAAQEFALPPLEEQRRLATLLQMLETVAESVVSARSRLYDLRHSVEKQTFLIGSTTDEALLGTLIQHSALTLQTGPFGTVLKASSYTDYGHPVVNPSDMSDGKIVLDNCRFIGDADWERLERYQVKTNDIFIGRKGDMQNLIYVTPEYDGYLLGSDCIRFRVHDESMLSQYFYFYLRAETTRQWLQSQAYGTIMPGINERLLAKMKILLPNLKKQRAAVDELESIDETDQLLQQRLSQTRKLKVVTLSPLNEYQRSVDELTQ
ncbi:MAG: restriction endonuclease subunit S [Caldilinea sp.]|nr:restriction endonuclease subunit S [Caldilinea sp.]MCW5843272.1 restriction endonuclease subunit S [Caldilinea sp.]